MRRIFAASVIAAALFGATACNAAGTDTTAGPSATTASSSPSVVLVDKKTTCANYKAIEEAAKQKMAVAAADAYKVMTEKDPGKLDALALSIFAGMKAAIGDIKTGMQKEQAQAGDPELKAQLAIVAAEMSKVEAAIATASTAADLEKLSEWQTKEGEAASAKIEELCK